MRIIYLLILFSLISIAFLWLGKYGVIRKKVAMISACASLLCGGTLLAMAVLPGNTSRPIGPALSVFPNI